MREALPLALSGIFKQGNVGCIKRVCRGLILLYHRLTVRPGMAMTVKEMGAGDLHSPAPFHFRGELHHGKLPARQSAWRHDMRRCGEAFHGDGAAGRLSRS
jgi:hypothetical protein